MLAAAIRSGSQTIVTFNLKDFPMEVLDPMGIEARHPDDFVMDQIDLAPGLVVGALLSGAVNPKEDVLFVSHEQVCSRIPSAGL